MAIDIDIKKKESLKQLMLYIVQECNRLDIDYVIMIDDMRAASIRNHMDMYRAVTRRDLTDEELKELYR